MENKLAVLDTSILIDYFRAKDKTKTQFMQLISEYTFFISVVTKYEFLAGTKPENIDFTNSIIENIEIQNLDSETIDIAIKIYNNLKSKNKLIDTPDIFIAATAIKADIPLATLNKNDFSRIENLIIL